MSNFVVYLIQFRGRRIHKYYKIKIIIVYIYWYNIINNVSEQSATIVENEIRKYITNVNQQIEIDISRQQEVLEKTLQDIKMDIAVEENSKADTLGDFEKDLNTIKSFAVQMRKGMGNYGHF